ncbi:zinc finger domain-containing protein [Microbacterium sp. 69-10]|nr:zinc finger domain-containing protein [Microbacterium sp. 69-10]
MAVHGRGGQACPVCGSTIVDQMFAGASAQSCPQCQPERDG